MMGGGEGDIAAEGLWDVENTIFVAVGKNAKESKSTLLWALQSFADKNICLLHIHQPEDSVANLNEKFSVNKPKQEAIKACRELEQQKMNKLLNQYFLILADAGVHVGKVWMGMDNVEKGIVQIIAQHNIRWLVMGAADKQHSMKLLEFKSSKAAFVCQHAPVTCHIWVACNGCLIYTRARNGNFSSHVGSIRILSSPMSSNGTKLVQNHAHTDEGSDEPEEMSRGFTSQAVVNFVPNPLLMDEIRGDGSPLSLLHDPQGHLDQLSSVILLEGKPDGQKSSELCDKLEHAMTDAENSKQKAFEESVKRWKAEEDAVEATNKAEALERSCMEETKPRKEMEEVLARQRQELESMKDQHHQCIRELQMVCDQKPVLESQLVESRSAGEELEEKILQAVKLLITFKDKRDKLQIEHDKAIREITELRKLVKEEDADIYKLQFFAFPFWEINEATQDFDPFWKIGDGTYGSVYKGLLRHMKVAIKMLPSRGSQGHVEFEQKARVLSRVRHPKLVTLIGTCPESRSLIYEYLENGSLEDHLACQGKTRPLSWQNRTKIASEICSVLIFLHSSRPCIVHGNLKPSNILLDTNFVSKLGDLCIYRLIPEHEKPTCKFDPEASVFVDPAFLGSGKLTVESDVYSFGIVLLRLLTGRRALGVVKDVKCALEGGSFSAVMDPAAGEWPFEQAETLAHLALRCCANKPENRPDLVSEVWSVIELMRELFTSSSHVDSKGHRQTPSHFVCPIFQEVMDDPQIAADGFTYEADAIKGWLNSGHKTSPMTNLELDHCDLIPNYALCHAIQEWRQRS